MPALDINESGGFYTLTIPDSGVSVKFDYTLESEYGFWYLLKKSGVRRAPEVVATVENPATQALEDVPEPPRADAEDYDAQRPKDPQPDTYYYRGESGTSPTGPYHAEWTCPDLQKALAGVEIRMIQGEVLGEDADRCGVCG